jgi:hypothetical protein
MYKQMSANNPVPLQACDRMANGRGFFPRHAPRAKEGCRMLDPIEAGTHADKRLPQHRQTGISRKPGFPRVSPRMPALDYNTKAWPPTSLY